MNLQECITLESQMASKNSITPFKYYIPWHFILLTFIHWKLLLHWEKYSYLIHLNSWDLFYASWPILVNFHIIFLTLCPSPHYTNMAFRFLFLLKSMQSKLTVIKRLKNIYISIHYFWNHWNPQRVGNYLSGVSQSQDDFIQLWNGLNSLTAFLAGVSLLNTYEQKHF